MIFSWSADLDLILLPRRVVSKEKSSLRDLSLEERDTRVFGHLLDEGLRAIDSVVASQVVELDIVGSGNTVSADLSQRGNLAYGS